MGVFSGPQDVKITARERDRAQAIKQLPNAAITFSFMVWSVLAALPGYHSDKDNGLNRFNQLFSNNFAEKHPHFLSEPRMIFGYRPGALRD